MWSPKFIDVEEWSRIWWREKTVPAKLIDGLLDKAIKESGNGTFLIDGCPCALDNLKCFRVWLALAHNSSCSLIALRERWRDVFAATIRFGPVCIPPLTTSFVLSYMIKFNLCSVLVYMRSIDFPSKFLECSFLIVLKRWDLQMQAQYSRVCWNLRI